MYQLKIQQLRLWLSLGWGEAEKANRQPVDIDLSIAFRQAPRACETDALQDTVSYDDCVAAVTEACLSRAFNLLEHLAQVISGVVERHYASRGYAVEVSVLVNKIHPPVPGILGGVSFTYGPRLASFRASGDAV